MLLKIMNYCGASPSKVRGIFVHPKFPCKCACFQYVLLLPTTTEVGYLTKQTICIKSCLKIQMLPLTPTTC
jgi:hypothetical protein